MLTGLTDNIHAPQQYFRQILLAMSEPATCVSLSQSPEWEKLNAASVGVLLTLCDQNTHVYFSDTLKSDGIIKSTQFHTQAVISEAQTAHFAFITASEFRADDFNHGDEVCPEHSATVVIQVDSLKDGNPLTLSGAGIKSTKTVSPMMSDALVTHYQHQAKHYPLGIDTILTCGNQLIAIPRTTKVEVT